MHWRLDKSLPLGLGRGGSLFEVNRPYFQLVNYFKSGKIITPDLFSIYPSPLNLASQIFLGNPVAFPPTYLTCGRAASRTVKKVKKTPWSSLDVGWARKAFILMDPQLVISPFALIGWLTDWLIDWLTACLLAWLIAWLIDWLRGITLLLPQIDIWP